MALAEILLIWLFLWGLVALFVASDASNKGRSAGFWFAAVFFLGFFGILAYVISVGVSGGDKVESTTDVSNQSASSIERDGVYCPNCGDHNPVDSNYCGSCGNDLPNLNV